MSTSQAHGSESLDDDPIRPAPSGNSREALTHTEAASVSNGSIKAPPIVEGSGAGTRSPASNGGDLDTHSADVMPPKPSRPVRNGGNASPRRRGLAPLTTQELLDRSGDVYHGAKSNMESHYILASRWDVLDIWLRMMVALAASLSALSLFQDNRVTTAIFAVATAVASALNAALDPARRSAQHRSAQKQFRQIARCSGLVWQSADAQSVNEYVPRLAVDPKTGATYDSSDYRKHLGDGDLNRLGSLLLDVENKLELVEDAAPPLNRLIGQDPDGTPRTRLGLWGLKHRFAIRRRAKELYKGNIDVLNTGPLYY